MPEKKSKSWLMQDDPSLLCKLYSCNVYSHCYTNPVDVEVIYPPCEIERMTRWGENLENTQRRAWQSSSAVHTTFFTWTSAFCRSTIHCSLSSAASSGWYGHSASRRTRASILVVSNDGTVVLISPSCKIVCSAYMPIVWTSTYLRIVSKVWQRELIF